MKKHDDNTAWRSLALELLGAPDLDPHDRCTVVQIYGWRKPGRDGLRRLIEIAGRLGQQTPTIPQQPRTKARLGHRNASKSPENAA